MTKKNIDYFHYNTILILSLIILILIITSTTIFYKIKIKESKEQKIRLTYLLDSIKKEKENTMIKNREHLKELEAELVLVNNKNEELEKEYTTLKLFVEQSEIKMAIKENFDRQKLVNPAYLLISEKIKQGKGLTSSEWFVIEEHIDHTYPELLQKLRSVHIFSEIEWQISLLIRLNVQISDISKLVYKSNSAVSMIRTRLYKKVFQCDGTPKLWDEFILSL